MELLATDCVSPSSIVHFFEFLLSIESVSRDCFDRLNSYDMALESESKPEYIEKLKKIGKQEAIEIGKIENLRKRYGL